MAKPRKRHLFIHLIILFILLTGCTEEDCLSDNSSEFFINFVTSSDKQPVQQTFTQIEVSGVPKPFAGGPASANFLLPVNPHADQTTYTFNTETTTETITISYSRKPQILSADCQYEMLFENLVIIESTFVGESELVKNNLTNSNVPNVTIYR